MIERWTGGGSWLRLALALAAVAVGVSFGKAASADWVRVASSPEVQVSVDTKSVTKEPHGWLGVWTKTVYASSQAAAGVQYSADMTRFVLDCSSLRYGITGGKLLDAHENVLLAFDSPADELQPVPPASKIDAVARTICATNYPYS
jgi:Surface-adhesin protein E